MSEKTNISIVVFCILFLIIIWCFIGFYFGIFQYLYNYVIYSNNNTNQQNTSSYQIDQSTNDYNPDDKNIEILNTFRDPIPDSVLITDEHRKKNLNYQILQGLPWDRDVGNCEVLKSTDRDLYKTVQDNIVITFY